MAYIPLTNEEEIKLANSTLSSQLMIGVYPSQKYINKVKKNIQLQMVSNYQIKFYSKIKIY
jgi:hypothetical protein